MTMIVLTRLRDTLITLFLVGTAVFFIVHLIPGNPAVVILGPNATPEQIEDLTAKMGLDRPLPIQYLSWMVGLVHGDMGDSIVYSAPVLDVIIESAVPTIVLAVGATIISGLLAIPLAVLTIQRPNSYAGRVLTGLSSLGIAIPGFWLALLLIYVFGVVLGWLPTSGWGGWQFMVLPLIVLVANLTALLVITLRESLAGEYLGSYVRVARAKGLRDGAIMYNHVLPNSLLPFVTVLGSNLGALLGGVIVIETVFVIPGIGWALNGAIQARDYALIQGITLMAAATVILVNLVVDLCYVALDPRVRVS